VHALIGLGNPGSEYDGSRHNLGFRIIDAIREFFDVQLAGGRGDYRIGTVRVQGQRVLLIKPLTYMNNSGNAVVDVIEYYKMDPGDLLVICDDFQLPLGMLRFRAKGSDGGHNGLRSIIYHLQSEEFPRLRCGISSESMPKRKSEMAQFVLSEFQKSEKSVVDEMVNRARDAALTFVSEGLTAAMNKFHTPSPLAQHRQDAG
jgi:PTH1 family peptidyl-tRNA hydrolase